MKKERKKEFGAVKVGYPDLGKVGLIINVNTSFNSWIKWLNHLHYYIRVHNFPNTLTHQDKDSNGASNYYFFP